MVVVALTVVVEYCVNISFVCFNHLWQDERKGSEGGEGGSEGGF